MRSQYNQQELDRMRKDPQYSKWGIFYFNPKDPRTILPKTNPWMGWTLNFGNLYAYLLIFGIIIIVAILKYS